MKPSSNDVLRANMNGYDKHVRYWREHQTGLAKALMQLRSYNYFNAFHQIVSHSTNLAFASVLDVGCGAGTEIDECYLKAGAFLVGLDISREMVLSLQDKIKTSKWENCFVVMASATNLPFKANVFIQATIIHALHHCPEPEKVLDEMSYVSKSLAIFEPNKESVIHRFLNYLTSRRRKNFSVTDYPENIVEIHNLGFTRKEICHYLKKKLKRNIAYAASTGIIPNYCPLPKILVKLLLQIEKVMQKIPNLKWQLGGLIIVTN